jgi:hypothetical protein
MIEILKHNLVQIGLVLIAFGLMWLAFIFGHPKKRPERPEEKQADSDTAQPAE